ncbi:MAG: Rrf2 family transcriptional regulator [Firmicutes bacterium]|nr:Rrf2 family transcriptional regulator [Bacillota bacterium]
MKISTRGRYGLRAMIDLAVHENIGAIPLREIAEREKISEQYLEQLFANLRKSGLVKSVRGAQGGYLLNHPAEEITVKDIITALEGPIAPAECVIDDYDCDYNSNCVTQKLWIQVKKRIDEFFDSVTLASLKRDYQANQGNFIYHI